MSDRGQLFAEVRPGLSRKRPGRGQKQSETDEKRVRQTLLPGAQLVKGGIRGEDVWQKYLGDCYLIAGDGLGRAHPA